MTRRRFLWAVFAVLILASSAWADAPVASYIFPAGGRRGATVPIRVGGLNLHKNCGFTLLGPGVQASPRLQRTATLWFEGPLLPLPDSQQAEDYPKDFAGQVRLAPDAPLGVRPWQLTTSQGGTKALFFMVGDLPEVIEQEIAGDPVPVEVQLPVTVNGRIFPRADIDVWTVQLQKGQPLSCEVHAARLGSPLDARLEIRDPQGRRLAENDDTFGADPFVRITAPADGKYQVRIHDANFRGGPAYVYRLTLTNGPYVERVYPLGGRRGGKAKFELHGQALPAGPVEIALPADAAPEQSQRLTVGGALTNEFLLDVDDLPEHLEPAPAKPISLPAILNGRISKPAEVDDWRVSARKGDVYEIELRAAAFGSPLHGVLTILDAAGKELARADTPAPGRSDPALRFTAPADGTYTVRVQDRFQSRGGPAFAYRLRIAPPPAPDFRLRLSADTLNLGRGGQTKLTVLAERLGAFTEPINLSIEGLPPGVTVKHTPIAAKQNATAVIFSADAKAAIQAMRVTIRGTATVGGAAVGRTATLPIARGAPELDSLLLAVTLPTPFKIVGEYDMRWAARGSVHQRRYKIERNGYDGPIEVSLADRQARHLQGVTGPTITVPAGVSEFSYPVHLPPWMETGRTCRVCVMGAGVVKDADGSEHVVTFSSTQPNEQLIAVVEPGRLDVELERGSLAARPGQTTTLAVRVLRSKGLSGPAKVELLVPPHVQGMTVEAVTVGADSDRATLTLRFRDPLPGPFNMPLTVRATVLEREQPVIGEAKIEIVPEQ
ncbi:MAG TPA: PPC domain-containing protein [Gemmataceae bacterium]|nr:PPC domain-containing protein [Gemmataceae bacterium]